MLCGLFVSATVMYILIERISFLDITTEKLFQNIQVLNVDRLPPADICLPYTYSKAGIVLERICLYDGPFQEDGTHDEVFSVGALIVRNTTNKTIFSLKIELYRGIETYIFVGNMIPPYSRVLIQENQRQPVLYNHFESYKVSVCNAPRQLKEIRVTSKGIDRVILSNESTDKIFDIILYHKTYLPEEDLYIGGKAYETRIPVIYPGQIMDIRPAYYISSNSRIIGVFEDI